MKISTVLDNVQYGVLVLPEFQRGYVWSRDQVRALMASLYRRYPVGGLLIWTAEVDRSVIRGEAAPGVVRLLLDGQQRVTSLYGVVNGEPPSFFQGNAKAFTDLYFDVRTETFEFYGPVKMRDDPFWISVTSIFQKEMEDLLGQLSEHVEATRELVDYQTRLGRIRDILQIELNLEEITGRDRTIDEVVEIFNRVNSGGTKLSSGDLALARICADWPDARNELRVLLDGWKNRGFDFKQEWLLRCTTAIATGQASFGSLRNVSVDEIALALKRAEQAVNFLLNLLGDRLGISHDRVLAGRGALAVLARLVDGEGGYVTSHLQQQRLLFWYVHNFLWGRYSSSTETVLQRDLEALNRGGLDGLLEELNRARGSLTVRPSDFDGSSIGARFYPMLYVLTRVGGARDLCFGTELSANLLGASSRLHVHHIFPKARLYEASYSRSEANALANFSFLTALCNERIGAAHPERYLATVEADQPGALESQWIPTDPSLWKTNRYLDFLAARRELLAAAANRLLSGLLAGEAVGGGGKVGDGPRVVVTTASEEDEPLDDVQRLVAQLGLAAPETHFELVDDISGEVLAVADLAWPDGVQPGLTQRVAFLLESDPELERRLGEMGYQFFVSKEALAHYLDELVGENAEP